MDIYEISAEVSVSKGKYKETIRTLNGFVEKPKTYINSYRRIPKSIIGKVVDEYGMLGIKITVLNKEDIPDARVKLHQHIKDVVTKKLEYAKEQLTVLDTFDLDNEPRELNY